MPNKATAHRTRACIYALRICAHQMQLIGEHAVQVVLNIQHMVHITQGLTHSTVKLDVFDNDELIRALGEPAKGQGVLRCVARRGDLRDERVHRTVEIELSFDVNGVVTACRCEAERYKETSLQGEGQTRMDQDKPYRPVNDFGTLIECIFVGLAPDLRLLAGMFTLRNMLHSKDYSMELTYVTPPGGKAFFEVRHKQAGKINKEGAVARIRLNELDKACLVDNMGEHIDVLQVGDIKLEAPAGYFYFDNPWHPSRYNKEDQRGIPALPLELALSIARILREAGPMNIELPAEFRAQQQPVETVPAPAEFTAHDKPVPAPAEFTAHHKPVPKQSLRDAMRENMRA